MDGTTGTVGTAGTAGTAGTVGTVWTVRSVISIIPWVKIIFILILLVLFSVIYSKIKDNLEDPTDLALANQPVNCGTTLGSWSACSVPCGSGTQTRSVAITTGAAHGGTACPDDLTETRSCNTQECPTCAGFICTDGTLKAGPPTCRTDQCTQGECCDATVTEPTTQVPSCTLPDPAPTGYVYGANKAVTGTGTTGITCDATKGWYASDRHIVTVVNEDIFQSPNAASSIVASCADTPLYSLSGCTQGCAKPVPGNVPPGYDLTRAPSVLPYGGANVWTGGSCIVSGGSVSLPVHGSCVDDGDLNNIDYYTVTGCEDVVVEVPVDSTQEWYIGEKGQNCTAACSAQGKTCSDVVDWGSTINSEDLLKEKIRLAIGGTDPDPDTICPDNRYASGIPMLNSRTGHPWPGINAPSRDTRLDTCYWDNGGTTPVICSDSNSNDKRLCKCQAN